MRRTAIWLSIAVSMLVALAGCSGPAVAQAELGKDFTLAVGQSAAIKGEDLTVTFVEVISDSRCPKDAICIWLGEVSCLVEITSNGSTFGKVLTQPGLSAPVTTNYGRYAILFNVLPYPETDKAIKSSEYRLQLTVSRQPVLSGGVLATFDVVGEQYSIFITNKETIDQVFSLQRGESQANIPSGRLIRGSVAYNRPWSWHIDSEDIHMAEMTIELCDGTPSLVEADLDYWLDTVQRFCPWGAKLIQIQDFR